jgi:hypothetical protein
MPFSARPSPRACISGTGCGQPSSQAGGPPVAPIAVGDLRTDDQNRMPPINRALTTRWRRSRCNIASFGGEFRCSRAAGMSSTSARVAACSAESRSVPATAMLNFGARPRDSTFARSFVPTTPRKRNSASAGPPQPRTPGLAPVRLTSKTISSSLSRPAQPVSGGALKLGSLGRVHDLGTGAAS